MTVLRSLKPFIPSGPDFERAKSFFVELGFRVAWESDGLAELRLDGAAFLLQSFDDPHVSGNLMMLVSVDDLDAWWRRLAESGVLARYGARAKEPTVYPWGQREVHLIDPAGVCWHFA
jgi:uncharacterized glyoxalase superfamily protein PhnB